MKHVVTRFKSLKICLKELEPFIRDGEHLRTGKPFKQFGNIRSREILSNWLLCVARNFEQQSDHLMLCTDPLGGDGVIYDNEKKETWLTEHTLVLRNDKQQDIESLIIEAIEKKQNKGGAAYASGRVLVILLEDLHGDKWCPNKIARELPKNLDFEDVWIVGLKTVEQEEYIYNVTNLDADGCPIWQVRIEKNFDVWGVKRIQYNSSFYFRW